MKLTGYIENAKKTLLSFEVLPPLKGRGIESLYNVIDPMMELNPSFINVTYHREEFILRKRTDGSFDKVSLRKRPGTVSICAAIMNKYKVEAIPHLICGGFSKEETENALIDLNFLGIDNVLALRGDNVKGERNFSPEPKGNANALELIRQIQDMNNAIYLDEELRNPNPTNFCIGCAGYPEKHIDAPNLNSDLRFLKRKEEAGSEFIITQMFFDNSKFLKFKESCENDGINIPIIPGLKPITNKKQIYALPKIFNIDIPEELCTAIESAKNDDQAKEIGVEWCIQQSKELQNAGVPVLHYYTMSRSDEVFKIASSVF